MLKTACGKTDGIVVTVFTFKARGCKFGGSGITDFY